MAVYVITNEYVELNSSSSINDHVKSAVLTIEAPEHEVTAMGKTWKVSIAGRKEGTLTLEFYDDYAANNVDAFLWPLLGTTVAFKVRPDAGAASTTNPN